MTTSRRSFREAINGTLRSELSRSDRVVVLGETVRLGGSSGVMRGLFSEFGPRRIIETPVSENAILGAALGLALKGFVPVVEIYSADFLLAVANEVLSDIPKWRNQHQSPKTLPITIRGPMGGSDGLGPEHCQSMPPFLHHAPGLQVVVPSTPLDAVGLLRTSIRSPDPVVYLEDRRLYEEEGDVPDGDDFTVGIGEAHTVAVGSDLTIVAWAYMRRVAEQAVEELKQEGISGELVDPRTVKPMDWKTLAASTIRTGRLLIVEEAPRNGSVSGEVVARMVEAAPGTRVCRVTMPDDAIRPYSARMEATLIPGVRDVVRAARYLVSATR
jgi:pyruvate/2-oxoglutarate/acetoin dehydrogenase E1 component